MVALASKFRVWMLSFAPALRAAGTAGVGWVDWRQAGWFAWACEWPLPVVSCVRALDRLFADIISFATLLLLQCAVVRTLPWAPWALAVAACVQLQPVPSFRPGRLWVSRPAAPRIRTTFSPAVAMRSRFQFDPAVFFLLSELARAAPWLFRRFRESWSWWSLSAMRVMQRVSIPARSLQEEIKIWHIGGMDCYLPYRECCWRQRFVCKQLWAPDGGGMCRTCKHSLRANNHSVTNRQKFSHLEPKCMRAL